MANTLPTYVGAGSPNFGLHPALPSGLQDGDLVFAVATESDGTVGNTWGISNAPWQILTQLESPANTVPMTIGWAYYFAAQGLAAPLFTVSGSASSISTVVFNFRNVRLSSPFGASASNAVQVTNPATCGSITATAGNSLALCFAFTGGSFAQPSGWSASLAPGALTSLNTKTLTNAGDTTGAISTSIGSSTWADVLVLELLGAQPMVADKYFRGLPYPGISR